MRRPAIALIIAAFVATIVFRPAIRAQQPCLHGSDESSDQKIRRQAALGLARQINTLEAQVRRERAQFAPVADLGIMSPLDAWDVHFATDGTRYSFAIKDARDGCHFAFFSDEVGLIYNATPIS